MSNHQDCPSGAAGAVPLEQLRIGWLRMIRLVESALSHATAALVEDDLVAADRRSTVDDLLLALDNELDAHASVIRAWGDRRVPAADLCRIVLGAQLSTDTEALGELARSVAAVARSRSATPPWPAELDGIVGEMGQDCLTMIATVAAGMESTGPAPVRQVRRARNAVGLSHGLLYRRLMALGDAVDVRTGVDITLVGQSLLRCAEHTVSVAHHLALLRDTTSTG